MGKNNSFSDIVFRKKSYFCALKFGIHLIHYFMKKIVILLFVATALLSFSCNKYCRCKHYVYGKLDKDYKGEFVKESGNCEDYNTKRVDENGVVSYETKCK